jgi:hypothetical protein
MALQGLSHRPQQQGRTSRSSSSGQGTSAHAACSSRSESAVSSLVPAAGGWGGCGQGGLSRATACQPGAAAWLVCPWMQLRRPCRPPSACAVTPPGLRPQLVLAVAAPRRDDLPVRRLLRHRERQPRAPQRLGARALRRAFAAAAVSAVVPPAAAGAAAATIAAVPAARLPQQLLQLPVSAHDDLGQHLGWDEGRQGREHKGKAEPTPEGRRAAVAAQSSRQGGVVIKVLDPPPLPPSSA